MSCVEYISHRLKQIETSKTCFSTKIKELYFSSHTEVREGVGAEREFDIRMVERLIFYTNNTNIFDPFLRTQKEILH